MVMQFGQFLDHDISLTIENDAEKLELDCCSEEATNGVFEPGCFPILIPDSDPTFSNLVKETCFEIRI